MVVYKFGGASVTDATNIINTCAIIKACQGPVTVVVSAIGKTTNQLEQVLQSYYAGSEEAIELLAAIRQSHAQIVVDLLGVDAEPVLHQINDHFVEIDWIIEEPVHDPYDYLYDQIVSIGEQVSSTILTAALRHQGVKAAYLDARSIIMTDELYRSASVDYAKTTDRLLRVLPALLQQHDVVVTQGFIGSTQDNNTTTLGREGSDYSAAVIAYCVDAESLHIWKDVPGVLTADPRLFDNTTKLDRLSYTEAIEMTYYGAKVIHPKTIKPLQNKSIKAYVRPFGDPESLGTVIAEDITSTYPPMIVVEPDQSLLYISTRDFSFVAEHHLEQIFSLLAQYRIKVNMMRNTAISFTLSTNTVEDRLDSLIGELEATFDVVLDQGLELVTIRHYDQSTIDRLKEGKIILFEESLRSTFQMVTKDIPALTRK